MEIIKFKTKDFCRSNTSWIYMGLVLLKDLSKPPIPFGIFMPKSKWKNGQYLQ